MFIKSRMNKHIITQQKKCMHLVCATLFNIILNNNNKTHIKVCVLCDSIQEQEMMIEIKIIVSLGCGLGDLPNI